MESPLARGSLAVGDEGNILPHLQVKRGDYDAGSANGETERGSILKYT